MPGIDDKDIWQRYAKGVRPVAKNKSASQMHARQPEGEKRATSPMMLPVVAAQKELAQNSLSQKIKFDRRVEKQFRNGEVQIEAKLDLHGMTQTQAYAALARFIAAQVKTGHRNLLIITGKGRLGQSVLRNNLSAWLQSLNAVDAILALRQAAPKHGGAGAFYLILKRKRE